MNQELRRRHWVKQLGVIISVVAGAIWLSNSWAQNPPEKPTSQPRPVTWEYATYVAESGHCTWQSPTESLAGPNGYRLYQQLGGLAQPKDFNHAVFLNLVGQRGWELITDHAHRKKGYVVQRWTFKRTK